MLFLFAVLNRPIKLLFFKLLLITTFILKTFLILLVICFQMRGNSTVVLCLALYDEQLIEKMRVNTICFHQKHFESILDNICMLVFSDKLHHVCVKREESEGGKKKHRMAFRQGVCHLKNARSKCMT